MAKELEAGGDLPEQNRLGREPIEKHPFTEQNSSLLPKEKRSPIKALWNPETKTLLVEETTTLNKDLIRASIVLDEGKITVVGSDRDLPQLITRESISAETEKEAREQLAKKGIATDYEEGGLIVMAKEEKAITVEDITNPKPKLESTREIELLIPKALTDGTYDLQNGGDITVKGIGGNTVIESIGGEVEVDSCKGMIDVTAHEGKTNIKDSQGVLNVIAYDNMLTVDGLKGKTSIIALGEKPTILKELTLTEKDSSVQAQSDIYVSTTNQYVSTTLTAHTQKFHLPDVDEFSVHKVEDSKDSPFPFSGEQLTIKGYIGDPLSVPERHITIASAHGEISLKRSKPENDTKESE